MICRRLVTAIVRFFGLGAFWRDALGGGRVFNPVEIGFLG
jgi:hypothetical protein